MARRLAVPASVLLRRLRACTLELLPDGPLRPLSGGAVANQGSDDTEGFRRPWFPRRRWLMDHPEVVRGVVGFHWAVGLDGYGSSQFGVSHPHRGL